jgi:hypothetical protein
MILQAWFNTYLDGQKFSGFSDLNNDKIARTWTIHSFKSLKAYAKPLSFW